MPEYRQSCPHVGRVLAAQVDVDRYERAARSARADSIIAKAQGDEVASRVSAADYQRLLGLAHHASLRRFDGLDVNGICLLCGDSGVVLGNGSALVGGAARS